MAMDNWRRNLYAIFIAQFFVMVGFNFVGPFIALYIQQLGDFSNREAAFWTGMITAGLGVALFVSGPVWGIIADRWGRKSQLLRAQFCTALIMAGMALAPNVYWVLGLRILQGLFSGTMTAAQAMVASSAPREKIPFALGLLNAAVFAGSTTGPLIGGTMADLVGFKATFFITAGLIFAGGVVVLLFTREEFRPPAPEDAITLKGMLRTASSNQMLPVLITLLALQLGPQMVQPIIPVFIKVIEPEARAATLSGVAFGLMGVTAAISSVYASRLVQRMSLKKILVICCLIIGLLYQPAAWSGTVVLVILFLALCGFMAGGLVTSSSALVSLTASQGKQGIAYGVAQSANALGVSIGPAIAGLLAPIIGLRLVITAAGIIYIVVGLGVARFLGDVSLQQTE